MKRIIIIFGGEAKFEGATKTRFEKAIGVPAEIIIFSGRDEAELMNAAYQNNHPSAYEYDQVLIENRATNTQENLKFSFELIKDQPNELIFVSSWYHLSRIFLNYRLIKTAFRKSLVKVKLVPAWHFAVDIFFEPIKLFTDLLDYLGLSWIHRSLTKLKYKFYGQGRP